MLGTEVGDSDMVQRKWDLKHEKEPTITDTETTAHDGVYQLIIIIGIITRPSYKTSGCLLLDIINFDFRNY